MADRFKKTQAGQPLEISAEVWNSFLDTVREQKGKKHDQLADALEQIRQADIIKVRNKSGEDRLRFHVLGIDSPIITPASHLREFKNQVALGGVKPKHPDHFGRFLILLDPLRAGKIGRAWASGVCPAYIVVEDECHEFADVQNDDATALFSRPVGSARILWREGGLGGQWAVVRLSNYPEDFRRFKLTTPLSRCGSASAQRIVYSETATGLPQWCAVDCPFTVYDSLGIVCAELCGTSGSSGSVPAGTFGWAKWLADSEKWEVVQLGEGCCGSSSSSGSSSGGSSSGSSSGPSSSSSGSS